jgi:hypothetical protein
MDFLSCPATTGGIPESQRIALLGLSVEADIIPRTSRRSSPVALISKGPGHKAVRSIERMPRTSRSGPAAPRFFYDSAATVSKPILILVMSDRFMDSLPANHLGVARGHLER